MENVSPLVGFSDVAGLECDGCGLENPGDEGSAQSSGRAESRSPSVLCILHVFWRDKKRLDMVVRDEKQRDVQASWKRRDFKSCQVPLAKLVTLF